MLYVTAYIPKYIIPLHQKFQPLQMTYLTCTSNPQYLLIARTVGQQAHARAMSEMSVVQPGKCVLAEKGFLRFSSFGLRNALG
jgi:hypothetical protein